MDKLTEFRLRASELRDLIDSTEAEIDAFNKLVKDADDSLFLRRMKARVVFACIEAHVFHLKGSAHTFSLPQDGLFDEEELEKLQDFRRDKGGNIWKLKMSLKDNIRFAFGAFARASGKDYNVDFGNKPAADFLKAVAIRDRITHPKSASDWKISDSESRLIDEAWHWFGRHLVEVSKTTE